MRCDDLLVGDEVLALHVGGGTDGLKHGQGETLFRAHNVERLRGFLALGPLNVGQLAVLVGGEHDAALHGCLFLGV